MAGVFDKAEVSLRKVEVRPACGTSGVARTR